MTSINLPLQYSRTHNRFPNLEIWQKDWELPGKQMFGGNNKILCTWGPRRKEQWPHKRLSQTRLWESGDLWQRYGLAVDCCGVRGTDYNSPGRAVACWRKSSWRRIPLLPLPLPESGLGPNYREGTQPHTAAEKWIKDLLSMALPIKQDQFTYSQPVLPTSKLPQASSIRGQTEWKPQQQKANQTDHMDYNLV